jgi:hypothetical protein
LLRYLTATVRGFMEIYRLKHPKPVIDVAPGKEQNKMQVALPVRPGPSVKEDNMQSASLVQPISSSSSPTNKPKGFFQRFFGVGGQKTKTKRQNNNKSLKNKK